MTDCKADDVLYAKETELLNWKNNNVYTEVEDEGQSAMSVRWVVTRKVKSGRQVTKARLVARGFEESSKEFRTDSPTCAKETLRVAFLLIASNGWSCNSLDIKSAFLQGGEIERDLLVRPPREVTTGKLWKLRKTVYGLCDAPRAWYMSVKGAVTELGMTVCNLDQALFFYFVGNKLEGIMCIYVDDFLWAGTERFENRVIHPIKAQFKVGSTASGGFKYVGITIGKNRDGSLTVDQLDYAKTLIAAPVSATRNRSGLLTPEEKKQYRAMVGQLSWIATQTRPDISFDVCELSSVFEKATVEDMLRANKVVKKVQDRAVAVRFPKLSDRNLTVECFSDASFGNLSSGGSQGGYVIFVRDLEGNRCPIAWQSRRVRRVVKSTIAAETLALLDAAEAGVFYSVLLAQALGVPEGNIPVMCSVDNKSIAEAAYSTTAVEDKLLRINVAVLRDMLSSGRISNIEWVRSTKQLADVLTKKGACPRPLLAAIGECSTLH